MAFIGKQPTPVPLTASDITDGIISTDKLADTSVTNAKLNADLISAETELATAPADTDEFLISDAGVLKRLDASLVGGGKIGQVLQAVKTDTQNTTDDNTFTDISGLSQAITPSATTSKILVLFTVNITADTQDHVGIRLVRGSTDIFIGTDSDAGQNVSAGYTAGTTEENYHPANLCGQFLDSPSTTSATTYKIQAASNDEFFVNRPHDDTGTTNVQRPHTSSSLTLIEVLA